MPAAPLGSPSITTHSRKSNRDGFELHLRNLIVRDLGEAVATYLTVTFHEIDGQDICQVTVEPSDHPIYVEE